MKKFYFSFGRGHVHTYGNLTIGVDDLIEIIAKDSQSARIAMVEEFGVEWSMQYDELPDRKYFRGRIIRLEI